MAGFSLDGIFNDITDSFGFTQHGNGPTANFFDQLKNGRTNDVNKEIADQNLQFQRENFEYQKALQQKIFDREDSAYQRTVADMRQAGLSPLMMNGTNGAGEAIQTQPLHNDFQMQDKGLLSVASEAVQMLSGLQGVNRQMLENDFLKQTLDSRVDLNKFQSILAEYEASDGARREKFDSYFGIYKDMPEKQKFMNILMKTFGLDPTDTNNFNAKNFSETLGKFQNGVSEFFNGVVGGVKNNLNNATKDISSSISDAIKDSVNDFVDEFVPGYKNRQKAKKTQKKVADSKKNGTYKKSPVQKNGDEIIRWR